MPKSPPPDFVFDIEALKADLLELSRIGQGPNHGIYRMAFTDADMEARRWLKDRMIEGGLTATLDAAGNVIGRLPDPPPGPAVIIGSHTDTVPCGGPLDGALGVVVGLECMRAIVRSGCPTHRPVELISFSDEEGRFGGMLGSEALIGKVTPERLYTAKDTDGVMLFDAMSAQGMDPLGVLDVRRNSHDLYAYLELHIEQGPVLERLNKSIGIVEHISGLFKWAVRLSGTANHAGTTPMEMRNDAFMGLADFAHEIPRVLAENGSEQSRSTVGKVQLLPGEANTIPGEVEFTLVVTDTSPAVLDELEQAYRKALSAIARRRSLMFEFEVISRIEPVPCHPDLVTILEEEAQGLGVAYQRMPSGAAHDAQMLGHVTRTGMIFVPSKDGQSHSPAEWTAWADIEAGGNLALRTLLRLADQAGG